MINQELIIVLRQAALEDYSITQLAELSFNNTKDAEATWQQFAIHMVMAFDMPISVAKNVARLEFFGSGTEDENAVAQEIMPYVEAYRRTRIS